MAEFNWKLKDKDGKVYTPKQLPMLMKAYQGGEITDGDLLFQSDETKPWVEILDLKMLFQRFERQDISKKEKLISRKILDSRTYHITFLLFIFIFLSVIVIHLGITGYLLSLSSIKAFSIRFRIFFVIGTLLALFIFLFAPLTMLYLAIFNWKNKIKKYVHQQDKNQTEEEVNLKAAEALSKELSSFLEKNALFRSILKTAVKTSQFSAGFLMLHNYQLNHFVYETGLNVDRSMFQQLKFKLDEPVIKEIIRNKEIIWVEDIIEKEEYNCFLRPDKIPDLGEINSLVLIPLVVEKEVLGILGLYGTRKNFAEFKKHPAICSILKYQESLALGSAIQSELAILDRLTGLSNHAYFISRLREEIERSRRFHLSMSLLMIDIDYFKHINDAYGHQAGDEVLKSIAAIFKENLRLVDFCGRYGGEEFVIFLVDTGIEGAKVKAEQLRKSVSEKSFKFDNKSLNITVSIGLYAWKWQEEGDLSDQELIKKADQELYRAKEEGRNRTCFTVNGKPFTLP